MGTEVIAALVAGFISIFGFVITTAWNHYRLVQELHSQQEQWQESFRAELRRDLTRESAVRILEARLNSYDEIWRALKVTAGYEVRYSEDIKVSIQGLAKQLTTFAYGNQGLLMTDRSRRLLNHLRASCGRFLRNEITITEVQNRAHLLKHSMRSDLGIEDYEYESEVNRIALSLGRVDEWRSGDEEFTQ